MAGGYLRVFAIDTLSTAPHCLLKSNTSHNPQLTVETFEKTLVQIIVKMLQDALKETIVSLKLDFAKQGPIKVFWLGFVFGCLVYISQCFDTVCKLGLEVKLNI